MLLNKIYREAPYAKLNIEALTTPGLCVSGSIF